MQKYTFYCAAKQKKARADSSLSIHDANLKLIVSDSVIFNLSLVSQSVVDGATQNLVVELAGLLSLDVAVVGGCFRGGEFHVLDDEST